MLKKGTVSWNYHWPRLRGLSLPHWLPNSLFIKIGYFLVFSWILNETDNTDVTTVWGRRGWHLSFKIISGKLSELEKATEENQEDPRSLCHSHVSTGSIQTCWKWCLELAKAVWGRALHPWWPCPCSMLAPCKAWTTCGSTQVPNSIVSQWKQQQGKT